MEINFTEEHGLKRYIFIFLFLFPVKGLEELKIKITF